MSTLTLIITALTLAAKYEPVIAAAIAVLVPALREFHALHGDTMMLTEVDRLLRRHGISSDMIQDALTNAMPGPEGQSPAQV